MDEMDGCTYQGRIFLHINHTYAFLKRHDQARVLSLVDLSPSCVIMPLFYWRNYMKLSNLQKKEVCSCVMSASWCFDALQFFAI